MVWYVGINIRALLGIEISRTVSKLSHNYSNKLFITYLVSTSSENLNKFRQILKHLYKDIHVQSVLLLTFFFHLAKHIFLNSKLNVVIITLIHNKYFFTGNLKCLEHLNKTCTIHQLTLSKIRTLLISLSTFNY